MPLLDVTSAQHSLQFHLGALRARKRLICGQTLWGLFVLRKENRLVSSWKSLNFPIKLHGDVGFLEIRRGRIFITAAVTTETESLVQKHDGKKGDNDSQLETDSSLLHLEPASKDLEEIDERERLRRMKISKANKGLTPWNKGRKHSAETRQLIRERTRIALQNPKVKMKLANKGGHPHSEETKEKIAAAMRRARERRRQVLMLQESCHFQWQNLIAEASRMGYVGQEELQWDSYEILSEQIHKEWLESVEKRKKMKPEGCRRQPKSPEQRRKIAAAIAAKWTDPEYRERVTSARSRNHGTTVGVERNPRIKKSSNTQSPTRNHPKKASDSQNYHGSETKSKTQKVKKREATYKDPLASSKLELIKNIRAQRPSAERQKTEAIERARVMIAEAEMAAKALEPAAEKNPIALASLVETRKIIAEAIRSLESLNTKQTTNEKNGEESSDASIETANHVEQGRQQLMNRAELRNINDIQPRGSSYGKDKEFASNSTSPTEQHSQLEANGNMNIMFDKNSSPNGALEKTIEDETPPKPVTKTKKWVRGRLVEVCEEEDD